MVLWLNPPLQKKIEYRPTDTIISVPAKSGTTWTMNIFHQLRTGGDADFKDIYQEVPWAEFMERPDQVSLCCVLVSILLPLPLSLRCIVPLPLPLPRPRPLPFLSLSLSLGTPHYNSAQLPLALSQQTDNSTPLHGRETT